jgi:hypothetical protein
MPVLKLCQHSLIVLGLASCVSAPSLLDQNQTAAHPEPERAERYADACLISMTGAARSGQQLSKRAVKAIQAELADRQVDCGGPITAAIPVGRAPDRSEMPFAMQSLSFGE